MSGTHRAVLQDRVPQARIYQVWNMPEYGSEDGDYLDMVSDVLSVGKTSRLYKRLVYDDQIATDVSAYINPREIGGQFAIQATVRPGIEPARVETALDEEMARFLASGPTAEEVRRVRTQYLANFARGVDRIGGFGGKSDVLAMSQVFLGDPGAYKVKLARERSATPDRIQAAARRWLADGNICAGSTAFRELEISTAKADRTSPPQPGMPPDCVCPNSSAPRFRAVSKWCRRAARNPAGRFRPAGGFRIRRRPVRVPGDRRAGSAPAQRGHAEALVARNRRATRAAGRHPETWSPPWTARGASFGAEEQFGGSLEIFADVILNPSFPEADFAREQKQQLAAIEREKTEPMAMGLRVLPGLIYSQGHAYSEPWTGSGTTASVSKLTREDMARFHASWFKPNLPRSSWSATRRLPRCVPNSRSCSPRGSPAILPRKTSPRLASPAIRGVPDGSARIAAIHHYGRQLAPPRNDPGEISPATMNNILGGDFGSRINMNLREDKHWSYGSASMLFSARGQRPFRSMRRSRPIRPKNRWRN